MIADRDLIFGREGRLIADAFDSVSECDLTNGIIGDGESDLVGGEPE